jgi:hypothetical protein
MTDHNMWVCIYISVQFKGESCALATVTTGLWLAAVIYFRSYFTVLYQMQKEQLEEIEWKKNTLEDKLIISILRL